MPGGSSDGSFSLPPPHSGALSQHWLLERAPACRAAPGSPPQVCACGLQFGETAPPHVACCVPVLDYPFL